MKNIANCFKLNCFGSQQDTQAITRNPVTTPAPDDQAIPLQALPRRNTTTQPPRTALMQVPLTVDVPQSNTPRSADFERSPLPAAVLRMSHPENGVARIARSPKLPGSNEVRFELTMKDVEGKSVKMAHTLYVNNADESHGGRSTLGYSDIQLPEKMQGKGIGTLYHAAAAQAAKELGVDYVVVDSVVSPAMQALCEKLGMSEEHTDGCYEMKPADLQTSSQRRAEQKQWTE